MGNIAALIAIWPTLTDGITLSKLSELNAMTVPGEPRDISIDDVRNYLIKENKMQGLMDYVTAPPPYSIPQAEVAANYLLALLTGTDGPILHSSIPSAIATIKDFLTALSADAGTGVIQADANALLAMIIPQMPWWQANGFEGPVTVADLIEAGMLF